jgi:hypothetical protein
MLTITRAVNCICTRRDLNVLRTHRMMEGEIGWKANERMRKGGTDRLVTYR